MIGQSGNDKLDGANGDDLVRGGDGDDAIEGRDGNDKLEGEAGADTIDAGAGNDLLFGGDGNDRLFAAGGTDTLTGGAGNDQFFYTNPASGQIDGDTITDFQSVAGPEHRRHPGDPRRLLEHRVQQRLDGDHLRRRDRDAVPSRRDALARERRHPPGLTQEPVRDPPRQRMADVVARIGSDGSSPGQAFFGNMVQGNRRLAISR